MGHIMAGGSSLSLRFALVLGGALALSGCQADLPDFLAGGGGKTTGASARNVERDVEAPEVFHVADKGLWDGRPSLGGVWVAHPSVRDPERVMIRNKTNGQFVVGVVYRPERTAPGPKFQVSSDAAKALGMLAGQPAELDVTALRREEAPAEPPAAEGDAGAEAAAGEVQTATLDPIAAASQALDAAESKPSVPASALIPATTSKPARPAPAPAASISKPFLQIGIFSVEGNATEAATALRRAGMMPTVKEGKMSGKTFWRVLVGPATSAAERGTLLKKIKGLGFSDAYAVSN